MLTITVSKEINGKIENVSTPALDENSVTVTELNSEVQCAINKLLDIESSQ